MPSDLEVISQVPQEVIAHVLHPYKPECRYVHQASIEQLVQGESLRSTTLKAKLTVPCCYYAARQGTGGHHFNATEFILAFNQMGYILIAEAARRGMVANELNMHSLEEFSQAQMERILINRYDEILFRRQIDSSDFSGEFKVDNMKSTRGTVFYPISAAFNDNKGGSASGKSMICVLTGKRAEVVAAA